MRITDGAPARRPERPSRCLKDATEPGVPICAIESTEPMSMPSSSVVVATTVAGRAPRRRASASSRISRERLPWCGPELVRQVRPCRLPAEQISEAFHLRSAVGEDQVGATSQGLVEVS